MEAPKSGSRSCLDRHSTPLAERDWAQGRSPETSVLIRRWKARKLLARYQARPAGARVTLTHDTTEVERIWDHLFNELGFAEVGFAPVTSGDIDTFNLSVDELHDTDSLFETCAVPGSVGPATLVWQDRNPRLRPLHRDLLHRRAFAQRPEPDVWRAQPTGQVRHQTEEAAGGGRDPTLALHDLHEPGRQQGVPRRYLEQPRGVRCRTAQAAEHARAAGGRHGRSCAANLHPLSDNTPKLG